MRRRTGTSRGRGFPQRVLCSSGVALIVVAFMVCIPAVGRESPVAGTTEAESFTAVRQRAIELKLARAEHRRAQALFDEGLVSAASLDRSQAALETARLNLEVALLRTISTPPHITVREATTYRGPGERRFVRLTLRNSTPPLQIPELETLAGESIALPSRHQHAHVEHLFVSLQSSEGEFGDTAAPSPRPVVVAVPYEVTLERLESGASASIEFLLLRDVASVIVALTHRGVRTEIPVHLQQAPTDVVGKLTSRQLTLEADLGSEAVYDLSFERPGLDEGSFELRVVGLPDVIDHSFLDPLTDARLSRVHFPAGTARRDLRLRLTLPDRSDDRVPIDRTIEFQALAYSQQRPDGQPLPQAETAAEDPASAARILLAIIPRGVGKLELEASRLFAEIAKGESTATELRLINSGTRLLNNVRLLIDEPPEWQVKISPSLLPTLDVGEEVPVAVEILPPADVAVGDYELRIWSRSHTGDREVRSAERVYRLTLSSPASRLWGMAIGPSLLALLAGVVLVLSRIARS